LPAQLGLNQRHQVGFSCSAGHNLGDLLRLPGADQKATAMPGKEWRASIEHFCGTDFIVEKRPASDAVPLSKTVDVARQRFMQARASSGGLLMEEARASTTGRTASGLPARKPKIVPAGGHILSV
jgi:hypothetical protein